MSSDMNDQQLSIDLITLDSYNFDVILSMDWLENYQPSIVAISSFS